MPDMQKLNSHKEKILSTLRFRGPSLPVHLSKSINMSPLFTSAFLSELFSERRVKISNLKVGSSPLYYIDGQENLLENFSNYLNTREKEAYVLLKEKQILKDSELEPVTRVALSAIKDFAVPIRIKQKDSPELFWKYFSLEDNEIKSLLQKKPEEKTEKPKPEIKEKPNEEFPKKTLEIKEELIKKTPEVKPPENQQPKKFEPILKNENSNSKPKPEIKEKHVFPKEIKSLLQKKEIEILETISEKKKEFIAKTSLDSTFGKQEFYLLAKEKKKITENDIILAIQKSQEQKMPALLLSTGDLDKKALLQLETWKNLIKFEKIK
jgi:hypothetical protein